MRALLLSIGVLVITISEASAGSGKAKTGPGQLRQDVMKVLSPGPDPAKLQWGKKPDAYSKALLTGAYEPQPIDVAVLIWKMTNSGELDPMKFIRYFPELQQAPDEFVRRERAEKIKQVLAGVDSRSSSQLMLLRQSVDVSEYDFAAKHFVLRWPRPFVTFGFEVSSPLGEYGDASVEIGNAKEPSLFPKSLPMDEAAAKDLVRTGWTEKTPRTLTAFVIIQPLQYEPLSESRAGNVVVADAFAVILALPSGRVLWSHCDAARAELFLTNAE